MGSLTQQQCKDFVLAYAICTLYLVVLYTISKYSAINIEKRPAEDGTMLQSAKPIMDKQTPEDQLRRERVFGNNLENIPIALAVYWATFALQESLIYQPQTSSNETTVKVSTALIIIFSL